MKRQGTGERLGKRRCPSRAMCRVAADKLPLAALGPSGCSGDVDHEPSCRRGLTVGWAGLEESGCIEMVVGASTLVNHVAL